MNDQNDPSISPEASGIENPRKANSTVIVSSHSVTGSRTIPSEEIDQAFGMPAGKLRKRAGIESLAYAPETEDELTLALRAAQPALHSAGRGTQEFDWIISSSETHRGYPSLAARLHSQLLARENCGALDVGGACLGLLNGFAVAQGLIGSRQAQSILVITADVHSRILTPDRVRGEFGGLFGDGASAFVLQAGESSAPEGNYYHLGDFLFGCAGQYAGAIRLGAGRGDKLDLHFDGEALSRAAIIRLEKVLREVELRSGIAHRSWMGLATHQPNPRLVSLLAKHCGISEDKFPPVTRTCGNLGSSTCGVALDFLLRPSASTSSGSSSGRGPIFVASLGPGLLYGGGWLASGPTAPRVQSADL